MISHICVRAYVYIYIYRFGFTVSEDKAIYICDRPCNLMSCACFCVSPDTDEIHRDSSPGGTLLRKKNGCQPVQFL